MEADGSLLNSTWEGRPEALEPLLDHADTAHGAAGIGVPAQSGRALAGQLPLGPPPAGQLPLREVMMQRQAELQTAQLATIRSTAARLACWARASSAFVLLISAALVAAILLAPPLVSIANLRVRMGAVAPYAAPPLALALAAGLFYWRCAASERTVLLRRYIGVAALFWRVVAQYCTTRLRVARCVRCPRK